MGLLRKAAVAAGSGDTGTTAPFSDFAGTDKPKGPGLLHRSLKALAPVDAAAESAGSVLSIELAAPPAAPPSEILPFQSRTSAQEEPIVAGEGSRSDEVRAEILAAIASIRDGVELPSRLFTAVTTLLGVSKGALLLYDPMRLVYAPWAVRGYDQTTLHRMRIPLGANAAWNALANGAPFLLKDAPSIAPFQQYFSAREFSGVSRLVLVPFIAEEKLVAVLLLTEIDSPFAGDDDLLACLAEAAEAGAPRVHEARAAQIATAGSARPRTVAADAPDEPARFLESLGAAGKKVLLVSLSVEDFAKNVLTTHENLDPFRLHEDIHYFLGSFLADVGKALSPRQGRFTVGLPDYEPAGLDLFIHQLSLYLHGLFGGSADPADRVTPRVITTLQWPADGADLQKLVTSLSS